VIGSQGGIKRHLLKTHKVHHSEYPDVSDPRKKIQPSELSEPTEASVPSAVAILYQWWKDTGEQFGWL
jgi:hypothetical protein